MAYYLHWPMEEIFGLPHAARARVIREVGSIHERLARAETELGG